MPQGGSLAVIGPNGAGKTTLLRLLALRVKPSQGAIYWNGKDISQNRSKWKERVGTVFHQVFLYENLTAYQNLLFFGQIYGVSNLKERITEILKRMGLYLFSHSMVKTYSQGMKQRLSIARGILHQPDLFLLDEPFSSLDSEAQTLLHHIIDDLRSQRKTIILVTHSMDVAAKSCDHWLLLKKGQQRLMGELLLTTEELHSKYQALLVGK